MQHWSTLHLIIYTVCPNISRPHPLCLFSKVASRLSSSDVPSMTFTTTLVLPAQWQLLPNLSFYLLTYYQTWTCHCAMAQAPPIRRTQAPPLKNEKSHDLWGRQNCSPRVRPVRRWPTLYATAAVQRIEYGNDRLTPVGRPNQQGCYQDLAALGQGSRQ